MNTSVATISPQTAPRSIEELSKIGIFQLRLLIEKVGGLNTPEQKQAFSGMKAEEKVQLAYNLLAIWDKTNGGPQAPPPAYTNGTTAPSAPFQQPGVMPAMNAAPPAMAPMAATPMQQQPLPLQTGGMPPAGPGFGFPQGGGLPAPTGMPGLPGMPAPQIAQVDPAAVAAAQAAAAPTTSGRKPRTAKADTGGGELAPEVLNALTSLGQGLAGINGSIAQLSTSVGALLEDAKKNATMRDDIKGLAASYQGMYTVLGQWDGRITQLQNTTNILLTVILMMAEQSMGASRTEILNAALGDVPGLVQYLQSVLNPGKG